MQKNVQINSNAFIRDLNSGYAYVNINRFEKQVENEGVAQTVWMASWQFKLPRQVQTGAIVSEIVRLKYSAAQAEAILANYAQKKDVLDYLRFQSWREVAKELAADQPAQIKKTVRAIMPLSFALSGGRYEALADRVLKLGSPYEIHHATDGTEMVTVYLSEILPDHAAIIGADPDVDIEEITLINPDEIF